MTTNRLIEQQRAAVLALADGSVFPGVAIGADGHSVGEVVFNTSMTGYQEILTDPSYAEQMITLTYPHVGNVGVNLIDTESNRIWAAGLIIRDLSPVVSSWRGEQSLVDYLQTQGVVGIADVDTRRLTRILREKGAQHGCIMTGGADPREAVAKAQQYAGLNGKDLAKVVCVQQPKKWRQGSFDLESNQFRRTPEKYHVVVYDFGVKHQILRLLADRGCRLTIVPATMPVAEVLALNPDGVFLSNGPGDPAACEYAIKNIQTLLDKELPLFGICLGFQLLNLACGAKTLKMKFGHHGANHPVKDLVNNTVFITSQNHGFAVDEATLPDTLKITHRSLFDNTLQGVQHQTKPAFAFQGHPEASPGPHDIGGLFDQFVEMMR